MMARSLLDDPDLGQRAMLRRQWSIAALQSTRGCSDCRIEDKTATVIQRCNAFMQSRRKLVSNRLGNHIDTWRVVARLIVFQWCGNNGIFVFGAMIMLMVMATI